MADSDFTVEDVKKFMLSKGGKVRNNELVTNFKRYLNHPQNKASNREKFKEFVNTLAKITVEENGEKVLVLKKKFRNQPNMPSESPSLLSNTSTTSLDLTESPVRAITPPGSMNHPGRVTSSPERVTSPPEYKAPPSYSSVRSTPPPYPQYNSDNYQRQAINNNNTITTSSPSPVQCPVQQPLDNYSVEYSDSSEADGANISKTQTDSVGEVHEEEKAQVVSVLERARHLNKIESETELQTVQPARKRDSKIAKGHDHDGDDVSYVSVTLNETEREWMLIASSADYQALAKLLNNNPHLAKRKDFTSGLTALHWAAKHGKADVIKLIAGHRDVNVNSRSHGGYTALHLASMHGREDIIELLVQTYGADPNIRDHSGKKPKQYLKNSASTRAAQLLQTRRIITASQQGSSTSESSLVRTGSISAKVRKTTHAFSSLMGSAAMRNSWAGVNNDGSDSRRTTPSPGHSPGQSPLSQRHNIVDTIREHRTGSFGSHRDRDRDRNIMPPPKAPLRKNKSKYDPEPEYYDDRLIRSESAPIFDQNYHNASYV